MALSQLFDVSGRQKTQFALTVSPTPINALSIAKTGGLQSDSQLLRFSLLQLPVNVQATYKILLTVPIRRLHYLTIAKFYWN